MAKEIKYKVEDLLCKEKCPHTGNYIGSIVCWYCQYNERKLTKGQVFDGERIVYCNHPKWVDDLYHYNMEKLFEYASEYAKGYADVGYDEDQIASVRDAFLDGAKWQKNHVWHKPDEPIEDDAEVLIEYENGFHDVACYIKDEDVLDTGACRLIRKHITRWAYTKDLIQL